MKSKILLVRNLGNTARFLKLAKPLFDEIHFFDSWEQANSLLRSNKAEPEEALVFTTSDARPTKAWRDQMLKLLQKTDFVSGDLSFMGQKPEQKTYAKIFQARSKKSTQGQGYALPWGTLENFATTRKVWQAVGELSPVSEWAAEKDWSWRAILLGHKLGYCSTPLKVDREVSATKLQEFFDRGSSDSWLQRTYQFLNGDLELVLPLSMGVEGFERLWQKGDALRARWAFAYGSGMQWGYTQSLRSCPLPRAAKQTVFWQSNKAIEVFVPNHGITRLAGQAAQFFLLSRQEKNEAKLLLAFQKIFRLSATEAKEEMPQFLANF
jgi:hypothetical protein